MTDIATRFPLAASTQGVERLLADWLLGNNGLVADDGLHTAVLISLYSDRLANADDVLPEIANPGALPDRRGWWADGLGPGDEAGDRIGSRLWLLARAKRTMQNLRAAEAYAREALAWMVTDGIANRVEASAAWGGERADQLQLTVTIHRADAQPARYALAWAAETGA